MVYGLEGAWGYGKGDPCSPGAASVGCGAAGWADVDPGSWELSVASLAVSVVWGVLPYMVWPQFINVRARSSYRFPIQFITIYIYIHIYIYVQRERKRIKYIYMCVDIYHHHRPSKSIH